MTLTKEQSSNKEWLESETTENLIEIIRTAMGEGCIRPCHVYDAVDEALDRLAKWTDLSRTNKDNSDGAKNGEAVIRTQRFMRDVCVKKSGGNYESEDDMWKEIADNFEVIANGFAALIDMVHKPLRNCDVFRTREETDKAYDKYAKWNMYGHMERNDFSSSCLDYEDWFLAVYDPKFYQPYQFKEVDEP